MTVNVHTCGLRQKLSYQTLTCLSTWQLIEVVGFALETLWWSDLRLFQLGFEIARTVSAMS